MKLKIPMQSMKFSAQHKSRPKLVYGHEVHWWGGVEMGKSENNTSEAECESCAIAIATITMQNWRNTFLFSFNFPWKTLFFFSHPFSHSFYLTDSASSLALCSVLSLNSSPLCMTRWPFLLVLELFFHSLSLCAVAVTEQHFVSQAPESESFAHTQPAIITEKRVK